MMRRLRTTAAGIIAITTLAGCLGSAPATRFYQLEPLPSRAALESSAKPVTVVIRDVRLPHYLDRPQIVTRDAGHRLQIAEFDHWAGDLREDLTRVLVENLGRLLGSEQIYAAPLGVVVQPDYRLELEIHSFERGAHGRVELSARWWLARGKDASVLVTREASFSSNVTADSVPGLVAAMSEVYGSLGRAVADTVRKAAGT